MVAERNNSDAIISACYQLCYCEKWDVIGYKGYLGLSKWQAVTVRQIEKLNTSARCWNVSSWIGDQNQD
jgi:hypothetical protein